MCFDANIGKILGFFVDAVVLGYFPSLKKLTRRQEVLLESEPCSVYPFRLVDTCSGVRDDESQDDLVPLPLIY